MKTLVTFEVDTNELFDTLQKMKGDFAPLGERLVGALLVEPSYFDALGMAFYSVSVKSRKQVAEAVAEEA